MYSHEDWKDTFSRKWYDMMCWKVVIRILSALLTSSLYNLVCHYCPIVPKVPKVHISWALMAKLALIVWQPSLYCVLKELLTLNSWCPSRKRAGALSSRAGSASSSTSPCRYSAPWLPSATSTATSAPWTLPFQGNLPSNKAPTNLFGFQDYTNPRYSALDTCPRYLP